MFAHSLARQAKHVGGIWRDYGGFIFPHPPLDKMPSQTILCLIKAFILGMRSWARLMQLSRSPGLQIEAAVSREESMVGKRRDLAFKRPVG
jgi:hypothetical protein